MATRIDELDLRRQEQLYSSVATQQPEAAPPSSQPPSLRSLLSPEMETLQKEASALGMEPWMRAFQKSLSSDSLPPDPLSNADPKKIVTTHLLWNVENLDFEKKVLSARATYTYINKDLENNCLVLDATDLIIESVTVNGQEVQAEVIEKDKNSIKPGKLSIPIPAGEKSGAVSIKYRTSPSATGIFWIKPEMTDGKKHPMVYTLFESVEGASVIPGQHTPQVRLTFEVNASTGSSDLMALSSVSNNPKVRNETGRYEHLKMGRAVPLYLLSLQVGNFSSKGYDQETGVYAEDAIIEKVHEICKRLPEFFAAAQKICGRYNWGTYTPVFLSKAFPYMAMEHPCASSCGQTALERLSVLVHELAHAWAGNDITNCNWRQFFWNEGTTCFIEYLICQEIFEPDFANMEFGHLLEEMRSAMDEYRESHNDRLSLCQKTDDFQFSRIPYGKGALFFLMLRNALGHEDFNRFFQDYMKVFYQNTMSDTRFLAFLELWLKHEKGMEDFEKFKSDHYIDAWLYEPELPPNTPTEFKSKFVDEIHTQRELVLKNQSIDRAVFDAWSPLVRANFISSLIGNADFAQLLNLDIQLQLTITPQEMAIREEWARACASANYITVATKNMIAECVIERNSMHRANQICNDLKKTPEGREAIRYILAQDRGRLFPLTREAIERSLEVPA